MINVFMIVCPVLHLIMSILYRQKMKEWKTSHMSCGGFTDWYFSTLYPGSLLSSLHSLSCAGVGYPRGYHQPDFHFILFSSWVLFIYLCDFSFCSQHLRSCSCCMLQVHPSTLLVPTHLQNQHVELTPASNYSSPCIYQPRSSWGKGHFSLKSFFMGPGKTTPQLKARTALREDPAHTFGNSTLPVILTFTSF